MLHVGQRSPSLLTFTFTVTAHDICFASVQCQTDVQLVFDQLAYVIGLHTQLFTQL